MMGLLLATAILREGASVASSLPPTFPGGRKSEPDLKGTVGWHATAFPREGLGMIPPLRQNLSSRKHPYNKVAL